VGTGCYGGEEHIIRRILRVLAFTKKRKVWARRVMTNIAQVLASGVALRALFGHPKVGMVVILVGIAVALLAGFFGYLLVEVQ
jgi:Mn2+/Fe2+ NRAMP family transporter